MLGGIDPDERQMLNDVIGHFVRALNAERAKSADLERQLASMAERLTLLEAAAYGCL